MTYFFTIFQNVVFYLVFKWINKIPQNITKTSSETYLMKKMWCVTSPHHFRIFPNSMSSEKLLSNLLFGSCAHFHEQFIFKFFYSKFQKKSDFVLFENIHDLLKIDYCASSKGALALTLIDICFMLDE